MLAVGTGVGQRLFGHVELLDGSWVHDFSVVRPAVPGFGDGAPSVAA
jgi:hypothetical protein